MKEKIDYKKRNKEQRELSNLRNSFSSDTSEDTVADLIMIAIMLGVALCMVLFFGGSRYL